jgi:hypothetical protein
MPNPPDPALLAALEAQRLGLSAVLLRLEAARRGLVPGPADFWRGTARRAYDSGIEAMAITVEAGMAAVRAARDHTAAALARMGERV